MPKIILNCPDAAAAVSMSETKLRELVARGDINAVRVDGVMRFAMDDLVAFKDRLRAEARSTGQSAQDGLTPPVPAATERNAP